MKKVNLVLFMFAILTTNSCTKEYVCECKTVTYPDQTVVSSSIIKASKMKASKKCKNSTSGLNGVSCELK